LLVVDDYAPTDKITRDELCRKAERLCRAQGNQQGRQRLSADSTLRSPKPPRGSILSTGEDIPSRKSLRARLLIGQLEKKGPNSLNWREVTQAQSHASMGKYAEAIAGYIQWLARFYDDFYKVLPKQVAVLRNLIAKNRLHSRTPENAAQLGIGLAYY
jgi:hypothetical protein